MLSIPRQAVLFVTSLFSFSASETGSWNEIKWSLLLGKMDTMEVVSFRKGKDSRLIFYKELIFKGRTSLFLLKSNF